MKQSNQQPQPAATLAAIISQCDPFAIIVNGNALYPHVRHNQRVNLRPAVGISHTKLKPGTVVLAVPVKTTGSTSPDACIEFGQHALFLLNADGDLTSGRNGERQTIERGEYVILAVPCRIEDMAQERPTFH